MKDKSGREYAKLSDLKRGDRVELDAGFTCMDAGTKIVLVVHGKLCLACEHGFHFLVNDTSEGYVIGIYPIAVQHHEKLI